MKNLQKMLHKKFVQLGRERNRITYKLLALLPKINELKIYEQEGYGNVYDYAARIAGLSSGVVTKALKLEEKLRDMPHLQKVIETQGINKVGIVVGLVTKENEKDLAEKVEHMSKPALQEYSKEVRGKITTSWQVELDEKMMFMFLKLKKKFGKNLSNKECLRKILEVMNEQAGEKGQNKKVLKTIPKKLKPQAQAQNFSKIPGEKVRIESQLGERKIFVPKKQSARTKQVEIPVCAEMTDGAKMTAQSKPKIQKITHYIPAHKKTNLSEQCIHPGCHRPAEVIHHPDRFSEHYNHKNLRPLCKLHHEFAHNGISEPMHLADYQYRKHREVALR